LTCVRRDLTSDAIGYAASPAADDRETGWRRLHRMDFQSSLALFAFLTASFLAGSTGSLFRPGTWYQGLSKPRWRPPNWLFGPAWLVLYILISVSAWLVWLEVGLVDGLLPLSIYAVQMVLNGLWSYLFFGLRNLQLALVEMSALWLSILAMIVVFYSISATAAYLLVPYLLWVSFAWALNLSIIRRNAHRTA